MNSKISLIIDGNSFMYRAAYSYGTYNNGVFEGIISYISEIIKKRPFLDMIVCWDKGKSRWRSEIYKDYKKNRKKNRKPLDLDAVYEQYNLTKSFLDANGIKQFAIKGVEADDLIAWLVDYYKNFLKYSKIWVVTGDKDLWQLLSDQVSVYSHIDNKVINNEMAEEHFGVEPDKIPDLKSMVGDNSDFIKGAFGVGGITAVPLLNEFRDIGSILDLNNVKELSKKKKTLKVVEQANSVELSYRLVKLSGLKDAVWSLNDVEREEIFSKLSNKPEFDRLRSSILAEKIGVDYSIINDISSLSGESLTGMKVFFEKNEEERHSSLSSLDISISGCNKCSLRKCCGEYGPTLSEGHNNAEIMIIGRNPSGEEVVAGRPFMGRIGERLDRFLGDLGLTRQDCWITNVNKCYSENGRPPTYGEIMACSGYLKSEIDLVKPRFIISMGNEAMSMVTSYGLSGVTKHCGEILDKTGGVVGEHSIWTAICVHPNTALRSKSGELNMQFATDQIKKFLEDRRV